MESFTIKKSTNEHGFVNLLFIGGMLVVDNSENIKNELLNSTKKLSDKLKIEIKNVQEIDISFIQIILAFIRYLDYYHITYKFEWSLLEEQQTLLENVGFGNELFLN